MVRLHFTDELRFKGLVGDHPGAAQHRLVSNQGLRIPISTSFCHFKYSYICAWCCVCPVCVTHGWVLVWVCVHVCVPMCVHKCVYTVRNPTLGLCLGCTEGGYMNF